jgi:protein regulator of cytokinesis 1
MLLEIEQKCLELYMRKVDVAKKGRAQLQLEIAESEAELADICSAMGEQPLHVSLVWKKKQVYNFMPTLFFFLRLPQAIFWWLELLIIDLYLQFDWKPDGGLNKELDTIISQLEDMRKLKIERENQFVEVLQQIQNISNEFRGDTEDNLYTVVLDESDLSMRRLEELRKQLLELQNQKVDQIYYLCT